MKHKFFYVSLLLGILTISGCNGGGSESITPSISEEPSTEISENPSETSEEPSSEEPISEVPSEPSEEPSEVSSDEDDTSQEGDDVTPAITDFVFADIGEGYTICWYDGTAPTVPIPSFYVDKPVIEIEPLAFEKNEYIKYLTIPDSIKKIGYEAFSSLPNLRTIDFGKGVESLGDEVFKNCPRLKEVYIPDNITEIGQGAFSNCTRLTNVRIPHNLKYVSENMFNNCPNLNFATFDNGLYVGNETSEYYALVDLLVKNPSVMNLHEETEIIGDALFKNTSLNTIESWGHSLKTIGRYAFSDCYYLTNISLPESLEIIGDSAFENSHLVTLSFGNNVRRIENAAFYECYIENGFPEVSDTLEYVGYNSLKFNTCTSYTATVRYNDIYLSSKTNPYLIAYDVSYDESVVVYVHDNTRIIIPGFLDNAPWITDLVIPAGVNYIGNRAFSGAENLRIIALDENNKKYTTFGIGKALIERDSMRLISVADKEELTSYYDIKIIGPYAFENRHTYDDSVPLTDTITTIEEYGFYRSRMTNIVLPNSVTSIGKYAFSECTSFDSKNVFVFNENIRVVEENTFYNSNITAFDFTPITVFRKNAMARKK